LDQNSVELLNRENAEKERQSGAVMNVIVVIVGTDKHKAAGSKT